MKREKINGVTLLTPENDADLAEIKRLADRGEIDTRSSFGDPPTRPRVDDWSAPRAGSSAVPGRKLTGSW